MDRMKDILHITRNILLNIIAVLLILEGGFWFVQGINLFPHNLFSGQIQWAVIGGIVILAGIGLLVWNGRRRVE
jgi:hypothetical protein